MLESAIILMLIVMCSTASAETMTVGNYSIGFDLSEPHVITHPPYVPSAIQIKTFNGSALTYEMTPEGIASLYSDGYTNLGNMTVSGHPCQMWFDAKYSPQSMLVFYNLYIQSNLPFAETANFFESLKIKKTTNY
jgi:hypothetical protein